MIQDWLQHDPTWLRVGLRPDARAPAGAGIAIVAGTGTVAGGAFPSKVLT